MTTRRQMVLALSAAGLAGPPSGFAQQPGKVPRVGVLYLVSTSSATATAAIEALRAGLKELGYVEGRTVEIEFRSAQGRVELLAELAEDLVRRKVDVIVAGGGNVSTLAARKASATIPIVMSGSYDAVESGLVSSLAKPGANITGLTVPREVASKQLELLRECIAPLSRAAILIRRDSLTAAKLVEAKALVQAFLQLTLEFFEVGAPEELAPALANLKAWRPGAMLLGPDPLFFQQRDQIIEFARSAKIPAMYPVADFVEVGGLMSYGVGMLEVSRIVTRHVDKILKGAKPGDIPVEEPSTYDLTINLGTARALGLKVAQSFLLRAGRVIE